MSLIKTFIAGDKGVGWGLQKTKIFIKLLSPSILPERNKYGSIWT